MNPFNKLHRREPAWDEVEQGNEINNELRRMNLHEKHMRLIDAVNDCKSVIPHAQAVMVLEAWRLGVTDAGCRVNLIAADVEQMNRGIERPMCCGVFLDWVETVEATV